jgi:hypothetical protein
MKEPKFEKTQTVTTVKVDKFEWSNKYQHEVTFELEENFDGEEREYYLSIYDELSKRISSYPNIEKKHYKELIKAFERGLDKCKNLNDYSIEEAIDYMEENW